MSVNDGSATTSSDAPSQNDQQCYVCGVSTSFIRQAISACGVCKAYFQRNCSTQLVCENGPCKITQGNSCKPCRIKKCYEVGMTPNKPKKTTETGQTKECKVCGEMGATVHYGALCCVACRVFFEKNRGNLFKPCVEPCEINPASRSCNACRLLMCQKIGMKSDTAPKPKTTCQVCGDKARGDAYGSYACVGCTEFYKTNRGNKELVCILNTNQCEITIDSRTRCRACRLKKCLIVGMNSVKDAEKPCRVCGAHASGLNHGVQTCKGCADFFGREIKIMRNLKCESGARCEITLETRASCPLCRFNKCKAVGMTKKTGVKRPSADTTQEEDDDEQFLRAHKRHCAHTVDNLKGMESMQFNITTRLQTPYVNRLSAWQVFSNEFVWDIKKAHNFIELLPRLSELDKDDKKQLFKCNYFTMFLLRWSRAFTDHGILLHDGRQIDRDTSNLLYGEQLFNGILDLAKEVSRFPDAVISLIIPLVFCQSAPDNKFNDSLRVDELRKYFDDRLQDSVTRVTYDTIFSIFPKMNNLKKLHNEMLEVLRNGKRFMNLPSVFVHLFDIQRRVPGPDELVDN